MGRLTLPDSPDDSPGNSARGRVFEWGFEVEKKPIGQRSTAWHEAKARATRSAVLAGAARVFDRVGYRNAVVSEISKESETTAGAMYHYFPSKEAVALAVVEEARQQLLAVFEGADQLSPISRLVHVSARLGALAQGDPVSRASLRLALEPGTLQEHPMRYLQDWQLATRELVQTAIDAGELRGDAGSERVARRLVSGFVGAAMLAAAQPAGGERAFLDDLADSLQLILTAAAADTHAVRVAALIAAEFPSDSD